MAVRGSCGRRKSRRSGRRICDAWQTWRLHALKTASDQVTGACVPSRCVCVGSSNVLGRGRIEGVRPILEFLLWFLFGFSFLFLLVLPTLAHLLWPGKDAPLILHQSTSASRNCELREKVENRHSTFTTSFRSVLHPVLWTIINSYASFEWARCHWSQLAPKVADHFYNI